MSHNIHHIKECKPQKHTTNTPKYIGNTYNILCIIYGVLLCTSVIVQGRGGEGSHPFVYIYGNKRRLPRYNSTTKTLSYKLSKYNSNHKNLYFHKNIYLHTNLKPSQNIGTYYKL